MLKPTSYTKDSDDKGKQDMTAGMEAVQQGVDSANKAAPADSAKKKDDEKPSLKKGLKGLLKKP